VPTPEAFKYFYEALRSRPELVTTPLLRGAIPGAVAGGLYDVYKQHDADAHDWGQTAKRVGAGAAIGAGLGTLYGGRRAYQFSKTQRKLDKNVPDFSVVYHQALDNTGKDWVADRTGDRPATAENWGTPRYENFDKPFLNEAPTFTSKFVKNKPFPDKVEQVGPRAFRVSSYGDIRDEAGRYTGPHQLLNAPRGATDAWVDEQIDLLTNQGKHILKGLSEKTVIPDQWREGTFHDPEGVEQIRAYLKAQLAKVR
jgi:hypothetical protein